MRVCLDLQYLCAGETTPLTTYCAIEGDDDGGEDCDENREICALKACSSKPSILSRCAAFVMLHAARFFRNAPRCSFLS